MTYKNIEEKLKDLRPETLSQKEKNMLWSKIENSIEERGQKKTAASSFGFLPTFFIPRFAIVVLLIVALVGGSAKTVSASDDAVPGDFLFQLDIAVEKIQLVFSDDKKKGELRIKFAKERLEEAKLVLSVFLEDQSTTTDNATTTDTTASATDSTEGGNATTSLGSENATGTPPEDNEDNDDKLNFKTKNIEKAQFALETALRHLEDTKSKLENENNAAAVLAVAGIMVELSNLAGGHLEDLDDFRAKIKNNNGKLKIEIETVSNELNNKFKFELKKDKKKKDNNEIKVKVSGSKKEITIKNNGLKIEFKKRAKNNKDDHKKEKLKDEDDEEDEEENDNDDNNNDDSDDGNDGKKNNSGKKGKNGKNSKKVTICHIPAGNSENARTIEVGKPSSLAHLLHGDSLGECGENDGEGGDGASTTPDTIAPLISSITATEGTTTSQVTWDTDENSDSKVWYGTTTPLTISAETPFVSSSAQVTNHVMNLSNLQASTTYFFIISFLVQLCLSWHLLPLRIMPGYSGLMHFQQ